MSTLLPIQAPKSPEEEDQELVALDLQRRLLDIVEFQEAFDLMKAVRRQEEEKQELRVPFYHQPPKSSTDQDDDQSDQFSFYKFSLQHFQGSVSHRHITQRLRQPLLKHDHEGDALVRGQQEPIRDAPPPQASSHCAPPTLQASLTVWWIVLRFMEDMPEPKAPARPQSPITRNLPHRRARKLSNLAELDQVPAPQSGSFPSGPTLGKTDFYLFNNNLHVV